MYLAAWSTVASGSAEITVTVMTSLAFKAILQLFGGTRPRNRGRVIDVYQVEGRGGRHPFSDAATKKSTINPQSETPSLFWI
jgi:hypothetical protein